VGGMVMSMEFNLKVYFNMYKDSPIGSRDNFRARFIKKHGKFKYLPELIVMIEEYQRKKYGITLWQDITYNIDKKWKRR
jgi:hypothetical protein